VRDAEVPQEVVQLGDEEGRRDEARRLVAQTRRFTGAQLVVEHDRLSARAVQVGVREHVPVRDARSAVQHDEGSRVRLEVAEDRIRRLECFRTNVEGCRVCGHCGGFSKRLDASEMPFDGEGRDVRKCVEKSWNTPPFLCEHLARSPIMVDESLPIPHDMDFVRSR